MVLTDRERLELREAVVEYLQNCGLSEAATSLASSAYPSAEGSLEKRWGTIRRLSAKNVELEASARTLQAQLSDLRLASSGKAAGAATSSAGRPLVPSDVPCATLKGHKDTLTSVALHQTEALCVSSSEDGSIRLWDTESHSLIQTLRGHTENVAQVAIEPTNGALIASCSSDRTVKIYSPSSGNSGQYECVKTLIGHDEPVTAIAWRGDDEMSLISASRDGEIRLWDTVRSVTKVSFSASDWVRSLAAPMPQFGSGCSNLFASCGNDEQVTVWSISSKSPIMKHQEHTNVVQVVCFSHFEADCVILEASGTPEQRAQMKELVKARATVKGGGTTVSLGNGESVAVAASQNALAAASSFYEPKFVASGGRDKRVVVSEITSGGPQGGGITFRFEVHENWVRGLHFTRSGKFLVSVADDGFMFVFDLISKKVHKKIAAHDHFVTCIAFGGSQERMAATGSADTTVRLWPCL